MSSPTTDGLKAEIEAGKMKAGNQIMASTGLPVTANSLIYADSSSQLASESITASQLVYTDSSSVPKTGTPPFALASSATATTQTLLNFTGYSSLSGTADMTLTFVALGASTFTTVGLAKITVTDSGGNLTDGDYYIPFGTVA